MDQKIKFIFFISIACLCVIEAVCGIVVRRKGKENFPPFTLLSSKQIEQIEKLDANQYDVFRYHSVLGWTTKPNANVDNIYVTNSDGIRASRDYSLVPARDKIRLAVFGDSFTWGDMVSNDETWEAILEANSDGLEVLNFGLSGYGTDQAYLRYLSEGYKFRPHIAILCYMPENIYRNVNRFRPLYLNGTGLPLPKPRYYISKGRLRLLENPFSSAREVIGLSSNDALLRKVGQRDVWYTDMGYRKLGILDKSNLCKVLRKAIYRRQIKLRRWMSDHRRFGEAFRVTAGILEEFYEEAKRNGARPIIAILPDYGVIRAYYKHNRKNYQAIVDFLEKRHIPYVDVTDDFLSKLKAGYKKEDFFGKEEHYNEGGNRLVAEALKRYLTLPNYL